MLNTLFSRKDSGISVNETKTPALSEAELAAVTGGWGWNNECCCDCCDCCECCCCWRCCRCWRCCDCCCNECCCGWN